VAQEHRRRTTATLSPSWSRASGRRVRLAGIDAPEKGQPFGQRSEEGLSRVTFGKAVRVDWSKRDRYGRVVGQVWVAAPDARCQGAGCPKTLDAGLAQVTAGLAWHYKKYAHEQSPEDRGRYAFADEEIAPIRCPNQTVVCAGTVQTCEAGLLRSCDEAYASQPDYSETELCGDELDNNCDGQIEEGCPSRGSSRPASGPPRAT
jgi:endonuclease YncB( thermonuclease family)